MSVNRYIDTVTIIKDQPSNPDLPLYRRIAEAISTALSAGTIQTQVKLPPMRHLADELKVTVGTVKRAYDELEKRGLLKCTVGDGCYTQTPNTQSTADFLNAATGDSVHGSIDLAHNAHILDQNALTLFAQALQNLAQDPQRMAQIHQYSPEVGLLRHRQAATTWLRLNQVDCHAEQVMITNGAQHGLFCALAALCRSGDSIAAEHLSYPGLMMAARTLGLRLHGLAMDEHGLMPEALLALLHKTKVQVLYLSPTIHNPTTLTMPAARRQALADICREHGITLIQDEALGVLTDTALPSFAALLPEATVTLSGLSKAISPGLRIGYLAAPLPLVPRLAASIRANCWMASPLSIDIATQWLEDGTLLRLRTEQRAIIAHRLALATPLLADFTYASHPDCAHLWLTLPEPWRADEAQAALAQHQVLVSTADSFAIGRLPVPPRIRISLSGSANEAEVMTGISTVRRVLQQPI
ncbi:MAG: PLP-dependent aminotransferase family protein [Neisseriaceae bacterium]|nr:PLP-dependent aminotransferase family protein [Neisseriaceae bacterium]